MSETGVLGWERPEAFSLQFVVTFSLGGEGGGDTRLCGVL